ncbi:hypothetical protein F8B43_2064 [Methylorubrum populi]|uniref:Uncharacterized protein n=1 Tax=Methylorubrum populi TaxID=223967 RepID=A0A833N0Z3_9HYPH|nr:hypothetical protein F8B43_2064 [Methylorubrum populi]
MERRLATNAGWRTRDAPGPHVRPEKAPSAHSIVFPQVGAEIAARTKN